MDLDTVLATLFDLISPHLDERQRRLLLGAGARALGRGGGDADGPDQWQVPPYGVRRVRELEEPPDPHSRIRRPGRASARRRIAWT